MVRTSRKKKKAPKRAQPTRYNIPQHQGDGEEVAIEENSTANTLKRGRGPSIGRAATHTEEEKPLVWSVGKAEFKSSPYCAKIPTTITRLATTNMPGPSPTFHGFTTEAKQKVFDEFKNRYRFRFPEKENKEREILERIAAKGYCRQLRNARKACIKIHGWDTNKWKEMPPEFCKFQTHWDALCDYYGTEEFHNISKRNRENRTKTAQGPGHFGGSASATKHRDKMTEETGSVPTAVQLFLRIHARTMRNRSADSDDEDSSSDGEEGSEEGSDGQQSNLTSNLRFADPKAQEIFNTVERMKSDPQYSHMTEEELFNIASGGPSRGRNYGFGSVYETTTTKRARPNHYAGQNFVSGLSQDDAIREIPPALAAKIEEFLRQQAEKYAQMLQMLTDQYRRNDQWIAQIMTHVGMPIPPGLGPPVMMPVNPASFQPTGMQLNQVGQPSSFVSPTIQSNNQVDPGTQSVLNQGESPNNSPTPHDSAAQNQGGSANSSPTSQGSCQAPPSGRFLLHTPQYSSRVASDLQSNQTGQYMLPSHIMQGNMGIQMNQGGQSSVMMPIQGGMGLQGNQFNRIVMQPQIVDWAQQPNYFTRLMGGQ